VEPVSVSVSWLQYRADLHRPYNPACGNTGSSLFTPMVACAVHINISISAVSFPDCSSLDEMGKRVEDLEKNINELMQQIETREETSAKK